MGIARSGLAAVLQRAGRLQDAEREYRAALAIRERHAGPRHPELAAGIVNLATVLDEQGRHAEAGPLYRRALALLAGVAADHPTRVACERLMRARRVP